MDTNGSTFEHEDAKISSLGRTDIDPTCVVDLANRQSSLKPSNACSCFNPLLLNRICMDMLFSHLFIHYLGESIENIWIMLYVSSGTY